MGNILTSTACYPEHTTCCHPASLRTFTLKTHFGNRSNSTACRNPDLNLPYIWSHQAAMLDLGTGTHLGQSAPRSMYQRQQHLIVWSKIACATLNYLGTFNRSTKTRCPNRAEASAFFTRLRHTLIRRVWCRLPSSCEQRR